MTGKALVALASCYQFLCFKFWVKVCAWWCSVQFRGIPGSVAARLLCLHSSFDMMVGLMRHEWREYHAYEEQKEVSFWWVSLLTFQRGVSQPACWNSGRVNLVNFVSMDYYRGIAGCKQMAWHWKTLIVPCFSQSIVWGMNTGSDFSTWLMNSQLYLMLWPERSLWRKNLLSTTMQGANPRLL